MSKRDRQRPGGRSSASASLLLKARAAERSGRAGEAEGLYRQILRRDPRQPEALDRLGLLAYRAGKFEEAAALFQRAVSVREDPDLLGHLGVALAGAGQVDAAIDAYRRAIALKPAAPELHNNLGNSLRRKGQLAEAETAFRESIRLSPGYAEPHNNLALALRDLGRVKEAQEYFEAAVRLKPEYAAAWDNLGNLHINEGRLDSALPCFRRAYELSPESPVAQVNLAVSLTKTGRFDEAPGLYRRALQRNPRLVEAHVGLASCLAQEGRADEAASELRAALTLDPDCIPAYQNLSELPGEQMTGEDYAKLEALVDRRELSSENRTTLLFILARRQERVGNYDAAFELASRANSIERRRIDFRPEAETDFVRRTKAVFDRTFFDSNRVRGSESELPVFVLGLPRSGTTLVEQIIASHPRAAGAGEVIELIEMTRRLPGLQKATTPFPECVPGLDQALAERLAGEYLAVLRRQHAAAERIVDKLPFTFRFLGLVALLLPRARIIHCRRDPRDTAVSCFFINFHRPISFAYDLRDFGQYYQSYEELMRHWRQVLPMPILDVQYEALVADPEPKIREMLEFCGLEWDARCLSFQETNRAVRTASNWQVRKPMYASSVGRWRKFERHLGPLLEALGPAEDGAASGLAIPSSPAPEGSRSPVAPSPQPSAPAMSVLPQAPAAPVPGAPARKASGSARQRPLTAFQREVAAALGLARSGRVEDGERRLRQMTREAPATADPWHALGLLAYQRGNYKEARQLFTRAVELEPDNGAFHNALGVVLRNVKEPEEAIRHLEEAVRLRPEDASAVGNLGNAYRGMKQFDKAEAALKKAVELDPQSGSLRINLASMLVEHGRYEDAAVHVEAALRSSPDYAPALREQANILLSRRKHAEAVDYYRRAVEGDPKDHLAWHNYATTLQFLGRLDEAAEAYRRAIEIKPDFAEARRQLSGVQTYKPEDADLPELESHLEDPDQTDEQRAEIYFALSKIHGDLGHYEEAITCAQAANQIMRQKQPFDAANNRAYVNRLIKTFGEKFMEKRQGFGIVSDLPVFILGMPRSGTTLVEQILASHPQVYGAGELKKFHEVVISLPGRLRKNVANPEASALLDRETSKEMAREYLDYLRAQHPTAARVTDKMPFNFRLLGMIALLLPEVRIIHCRRDPMDVCLSCYFARFTESLNFSYNLLDAGHYYKEYERLMAHWRKVLPLRMIEVQYEELVADIETVSRRIVDFCGLEWNERCLSFYETERPVLTASNWQVRQPLYSSSVGRWRRYEKHLRLLRALLDQPSTQGEAA